MNRSGLFLLFLLPLTTSGQETKFIDDAKLGQAFHEGMEGLHDREAFPDIAALQESLPTLTDPVEGLQLSELLLRELEPGAFYEAFAPRVSMVGELYKCSKCPKWHTSVAGGFPITRNGVFVTNYHVLEVENPERCAGIGIMMMNGEVFPVTKVLAGDAAADIAIVRVDARGKTFDPLPIAPDPEIGSVVRCISHPNRRFFTYTDGKVSRFYVKRMKEGIARRMAITADYAKGSSGSPVFDTRGNVVGMVSETNTLSYPSEREGRGQIPQMVVKSCVPASSIRQLIKELPPM